MNKSVTLIPARKRMGSTEQEEEKPKLKVAAYMSARTVTSRQQVMKHRWNTIHLL